MKNSIRVTFPQVLILLASVVVIGILLFYMGYRAGKASSRDDKISGIKDNGTGYKEINVQNNRETGNNALQSNQSTTNKVKQSSIKDEMKLHQQTPLTSQGTEKKTPPRQQHPHYTIQVGAFSISAKAQKYADKFDKMGFTSSISPRIVNNQRLFIVTVGRFADRSKALEAKKKLEKMEKAKFLLVSSD